MVFVSITGTYQPTQTIMARINLWNPENDTSPQIKKPNPRWCYKCRKHLDPDEFPKKTGCCSRCEWRGGLSSFTH